MGEFDLIARFFRRPVARADLGIGDDCALLSSEQQHQMAISTDMLVEGRHFTPGADPHLLGHKCLAVNLSDLAACGASPRAFLLSLALPAVDPVWLGAFSRGLLELADRHQCELIGGDTTRGPLCISITVLGDVPIGCALLRSGARAGDDIYVSGQLGQARLALEAARGNVCLDADILALCQTRLHAPTPRVSLGMSLRGLASAAIDTSDGLLGDLGHILTASRVGATLDLSACDELLCDTPIATLPLDWLRTCTLSGGDDYELVFTAHPTQRALVTQAAQRSQTRVRRIGSISARPGIEWSSEPAAMSAAAPHTFVSFDHFAEPPCTIDPA